MSCIFLLSCGFVSFVQNPAPLNGVAYWAAQTGTPVPTLTQFLGVSTPVFANTAILQQITSTLGLTTMTTTPSLPMIGFTTPEPLETAYYRTGSFYMDSDVYIDRFVFRIVGHETQASVNSAEATYHYLTIRVTNKQTDAAILPLSDLVFVREIDLPDGTVTGRWATQNEPLLERNLPSYETQQLTPLTPNTSRDFVLGFVLPNGDLNQIGLITNWQRDIEGGIPIWFYLENDPLGPFIDAVDPPPPTSVVLDDPLTNSGIISIAQINSNSGTDPTNPGDGLWPTTGIISRGYGCHAFYTGINGAGFGCPSDKPWFHNGVDIASSVGTAVWSPVDGSLIFAGANTSAADCSHLAGSQPPHQGLGNFQKVRGSSTLHYFGHLSRFVETSGSVVARQTVAEMGSTGCSTGSHLHWIVYENGTLVNPANWAGGTP
ncbi:MAG: M23 family metallopeptidase [Candidatus Promineifilaceae bacterium]